MSAAAKPAPGDVVGDADAWLQKLYGAETGTFRRQPIGLLARELGRMWQTGRAFRRQGLDGVLPLPPVKERSLPSTGLAEARRLAWYARIKSRLLFGVQPCLFECVTVAVTLRGRGLPVEIVVGHLNSPLRGGLDEVHAWLEQRGEFVSADMLPSFYAEVARYA